MPLGYEPNQPSRRRRSLLRVLIFVVLCAAASEIWYLAINRYMSSVVLKQTIQLHQQLNAQLQHIQHAATAQSRQQPTTTNSQPATTN